MQDLDRLRRATLSGVRAAWSALEASHGSEIHGFVLATDDDVRTLYHVAATQDWIAERSSSEPECRYLFVDWVQAADDSYLVEANTILSEFSDLDYGDRLDEPHAGSPQWAKARDARFRALVESLVAARKQGVLPSNVLAWVGSTDPSDHLLGLEAEGFSNINSAEETRAFLAYLEQE